MFSQNFLCSDITLSSYEQHLHSQGLYTIQKYKKKKKITLHIFGINTDQSVVWLGHGYRQ